LTETASSSSADDSQGGLKFGFIWLQPGVSRLNAAIFCYSAFATIGFLAFVSTGTALVLNEVLHIPISEQGGISGDLVVVTEIVQLLIFGVVGVIADRIGRREVFSIGIFVMGLGYLLYPFAETVTQLLAFRAVYAAGLGASTGMLQTIVADYPQDRSRGKMVALSGLFNGLGVIAITVIFGRFMPPALVEMGYDELTATRLVHIFIFIACAISSVIYFFGLKKGTPAKSEERPPIRELILSGLSEARNPRIALAYAAAFVARSDLVVLGTFTVLWGTVVGISQGMSSTDAAAAGAKIFIIAQASALVWLGVLGSFMDRINRVTGTIICMSLAAIGFGSMLLIDDPLSSEALPFFFLLGVGQISAFFGATTLISHEAPKLKRGAVVGAYNTSGAIGILIVSATGGYLFDQIGPAAPFGLIAALNCIVMVMAIIIRFKSPGYIPGKGVAAEVGPG
jgi:MFS family permease